MFVAVEHQGRENNAQLPVLTARDERDALRHAGHNPYQPSRARARSRMQPLSKDRHSAGPKPTRGVTNKPHYPHIANLYSQHN
jgi:hypothetical protein